MKNEELYYILSTISELGGVFSIFIGFIVPFLPIVSLICGIIVSFKSQDSYSLNSAKIGIVTSGISLIFIMLFISLIFNNGGIPVQK